MKLTGVVIFRQRIGLVDDQHAVYVGNTVYILNDGFTVFRNNISAIQQRRGVCFWNFNVRRDGSFRRIGVFGLRFSRRSFRVRI